MTEQTNEIILPDLDNPTSQSVPGQITLDMERIKKYKVLITTPMYGGNCAGLYMKSCLDLAGIFQAHGIEHRFSFLFNESLVTRARNYLTDEFIRSGFTHMLFIDSDIDFQPMDVLALLHLDKDIIGAPYPKKTIKWANIKEAIQKHPDIPPEDLEALTGDFVFNPVPGTTQFDISKPLQVLEIGTGFMLIKTDVFTRFAEEYPHLKYLPDHVGQANFDGSRHIHAFFETVIDPDSNRYLSEDYMFCQYWRNMGGEIWFCPWMQTRHMGTYAFSGNLSKTAQYLGHL